MVACPTCGGELEFIAQYDRYYCYTCKKYASKELGKAAEPAAAAPIPCPTCGRDLTFIPEYDRLYCYSCNKYAPKGLEKQPAEQKPAEEKPPEQKLCPTCGKPLSYVEAYGRWYCYSCKKYAPKEQGKPPEAVTIAPAVIAEEKPAAKMPPAEAPVVVTPPVAAKIEEAPVEPVKEEAPPATAPVPEAAMPAPAEAAPVPAPAAPVPELAPADRPPLEKKAIETGKKSYLVSLCQAYGLESSGNRSVLKQRLLDYMTTQGLIPKEEEEEEGVPAEVAPTLTEKPPEIIVPPEKTAEVPVAVEKPQEVQAVAEKPPEVAVPVIAPPVAERPPEAVAAPEKPPELPKPAVAAVEAPPVEKIPEKPPEAAPTPEVPVPQPKLIVIKAISPCPTCGRELTFIKTYNRYYCYNCRKYAPEGAKVAPAKPAAPKPAAPAPIVAKPAVRAGPEARPCPTCGGALSYIRQYNKWYCYNCKKYVAEKPSNLCPTCGGPLEYLAQYDRYYCYDCKKYAPERAVQAAAQVVRVGRVGAAAPGHTHGGIGAGVGLAVVALVMFIMVQLFFYVPAMLGTVLFVIPNQLQITFLLQFLSGLFLILAVIAGLVGVRKKEKKP
jgi:ribosomal protein S27AE